MTSKQVLSQVNVGSIFADFSGRLQVPGSSRMCENVAGDMIHQFVTGQTVNVRGFGVSLQP